MMLLPLKCFCSTFLQHLPYGTKGILQMKGLYIVWETENDYSICSAYMTTIHLVIVTAEILTSFWT
jgi:hypothetical protein